ncbi:hypothetical protein E1212_27710 [Jiangella ureilytica]|uniref:Uncharacterized protein n=1 Tax=Jiangella ureilytica TaxID=2530374 RepID=A0A4R4RAG9_9ACTN|nr:Imm8 family immunity protein [Jiangella ureilytica]TDC46056.1 hypothetical protein E1212_27710 [Jiangella ureilytica]
MRAALRFASSADIDVVTYVPADPADDGVRVRLIVGPQGGAGEESFDVLVCTPLRLGRVVREQGPQLGRIIAPTWDELAERVTGIGYREFEDHRH